MPGSGNVAEPGLVVVAPGSGRDHDGAGLGLPPRVDDRAALAADVLVVPDPRLGVDRLADRTEQAQRREVVLLGLLRAPLHEGPDGRGRRVEQRDPVLLDQVPEPVAARRVGRALVHHRRAAVRERAVHDVAVAGDPADVGGAPVDVGLGVHVEDVLVRERDLRQVAAGRVHDALGLAGGARRVEQEEQVLAVHRLGLGRSSSAAASSSWYQWSRPSTMSTSASPPDDLIRSTTTTCSTDGVSAMATSTVGLRRPGCPRRQPPSAVITTLHSASLMRSARESALNPPNTTEWARADAGARQQGGGQLGDHRHVDGDAVALLHAEALERVGQLLHLGEEVGVGDGAGVAGLALPVVRDPVAVAGVDVAVEAVRRYVEPTADEPLGERELPIEDRVPVLVPVERARRPGGPRSPRSRRRPRRRARCRRRSASRLERPRTAGTCGPRAGSPRSSRPLRQSRQPSRQPCRTLSPGRRCVPPPRAASP